MKTQNRNRIFQTKTKSFLYLSLDSPVVLKKPEALWEKNENFGHEGIKYYESLKSYHNAFIFLQSPIRGSGGVNLTKSMPSFPHLANVWMTDIG